MRREVREGCIVPRFYGVAYYDFVTTMAICYPVPINLVVSILRFISEYVRFTLPMKINADQVRIFRRIKQKQIQALERRLSDQMAKNSADKTFAYGRGLIDGMNSIQPKE